MDNIVERRGGIFKQKKTISTDVQSKLVRAIRSRPTSPKHQSLNSQTFRRNRETSLVSSVTGEVVRGSASNQKDTATVVSLNLNDFFSITIS